MTRERAEKLLESVTGWRDIAEELHREAIDRLAASAIEPLTVLKATTEFGKRLKAKVGCEILSSVSDDHQREEAVALSALRDLIGSVAA